MHTPNQFRRKHQNPNQGTLFKIYWPGIFKITKEMKAKERRRRGCGWKGTRETWPVSELEVLHWVPLLWRHYWTTGKPERGPPESRWQECSKTNFLILKAVLWLCKKDFACRKCPMKYQRIMGIRSATHFQIVHRPKKKEVLCCCWNLSRLKLFPKYAKRRKKKLHI